MNVKASKKKLSQTPRTIECSCGAKIILIRNVKLMSEAIEAHVEDHKQKIENPLAAHAEAEQVRDELITKVLNVASRTEADEVYLTQK